MLTLTPAHVTFAGQVWPDVAAISVDRRATREVVEWSDAGPHVAFADCPEQRIDITVTMHLTGRAHFDAPRPGQGGDLAFFPAPGGSDGGRIRISTQAVVLGIAHDLAGKKGALRTIRLIAVSPNGALDPISIDQV